MILDSASVKLLLHIVLRHIWHVMFQISEGRESQAPLHPLPYENSDHYTWQPADGSLSMTMEEFKMHNILLQYMP